MSGRSYSAAGELERELLAFREAEPVGVEMEGTYFLTALHYSTYIHSDLISVHCTPYSTLGQSNWRST